MCWGLFKIGRGAPKPYENSNADGDGSVVGLCWTGERGLQEKDSQTGYFPLSNRRGHSRENPGTAASVGRRIGKKGSEIHSRQYVLLQGSPGNPGGES